MKSTTTSPPLPSNCPPGGVWEFRDGEFQPIADPLAPFSHPDFGDLNADYEDAGYGYDDIIFGDIFTLNVRQPEAPASAVWEWCCCFKSGEILIPVWLPTSLDLFRLLVMLAQIRP